MLNNNFFRKVLISVGFWFPILLLVIINNKDFNIYKVFGNAILAIIIILLSNLFSNKKLNFILGAIGVIFFNMIMFIQITHYYLFNDYLRSSTFFIIFDSNSNETTEFLSMYIDANIIGVFVLLLLASLASIFLGFFKKNKMTFKVKLIYIVLVFVSLSIYKIRKNTFPHISYRAIIEYQNDKKKFSEITQDKFGGVFTDVKHLSNSNDEVYVLIIGESTTRTHMELYDYNRNTNPELKKMKEELLVFTDVITPHTHTKASLEKVLTLASHSSPNKKHDGTLVQLFNKAGFKTYWLSNQKPMGIYETTTTIISNNCDEQIFVSTADKSLDGNILNPFQKILKQPNNKKFIIIHLMGTHGGYSDRYPVSFEKFTNKPITSFKHEKAYKTINEYDNAILYNDFIISEIIKEIKTINSKSFALYFSDHGEDVYETLDIACHTESKGTKPMYDIPFVLWRSEKFKIDQSRFIFDVSRKYSSEDLLYTLSDLSGVTFKEFEPNKSLVSKNFIPKKRLILNNKDYDIFFNHK